MSVQDDFGVYDIIGVGFGPAGIALAVAIEDAVEERRPGADIRSLFIEKAPNSAWQSEMLLPGTNIQHHFLRDFATPRNPRSRYTFPNYLKEKGRLFTFGILHHNTDPSRIEWADYVEWVASHVSHRVLYNHQVMELELLREEESNSIDLVRVHTKNVTNGATKAFLARNIVLCTGRKPSIPPMFMPILGKTVFHSHTFRSSIQQLDLTGSPTIAVVGSGQNAIEILIHLAERFPTSEIYSINRNSGFRLYDLGHFSNEVYLPEEVDYFYHLPDEMRKKLFEEIKYTTFSAVDEDVSRSLYLRVYEEAVRGIHRIHVIRRSAVIETAEERGSHKLVLEDLYNAEKRTIHADIIILCTGYMEEALSSLLNPLRPLLKLDDQGRPMISRSYQVKTDERLRVKLFVNGLTERTHGISDAASFSMMALKAHHTLEQLLV